MNQPKYPVFASDDPFIYVFFSEGSRGRFKKGVFYTQIGNNLFNLGFGDWNEELQDLDDSSRTNNGDRDKVLTTVASTVVAFTNKFPNAKIFAEGSTPVRTRLYQMGISSNLLEINEYFKVMGLLHNGWESFHRGRNYTSFLITRK
jgi:hypothetical protein